MSVLSSKAHSSCLNRKKDFFPLKFLALR